MERKIKDFLFVVMSQNDRWKFCPWCGTKIKWKIDR